VEEALLNKIINKYRSKENPEELFYKKALTVLKLANKLRKEGRNAQDSLSCFSRASRLPTHSQVELSQRGKNLHTTSHPECGDQYDTNASKAMQTTLIHSVLDKDMAREKKTLCKSNSR